MPSPTYKAIATTTVGAGGSAAITFSSIPSTYTDLLIKISLRGSYSVQAYSASLRFNSDTGNNYTTLSLYGSGTTFGSEVNTNISYILYAIDGDSSTSNTFANGEIYIPNYTGSVAKSVLADSVTENNANAAYMYANSAIWTGTAAISTITLNAVSSYNFLQYSTATLYGISKS